MAKTVITDAKVELGGTDLGNHVKSVSIEADTEQVDTTGFGDTYRTSLLTIKNWTASVEFYDNFADNELNEDLFGYWGTSQAFAVTKADTTVSTTNPKYSGYVLVKSFPVFSGQFGQVAGGTLTLQGTGVLTRSVS